jgi:DNA-binding NtrC family response regulator
MIEFSKNEPDDFSVLLVEDEARLRELLLRAIPDMGFPAAGARTAEEALKALEVKPRSAVVLDLNLPGMSGLEFLEIARKRWPKMAVVILTGFGDLDAARKAIRLDVVDFLTKPCSLGELEVALDRARRRWSGDLNPDEAAMRVARQQLQQQRVAVEEPREDRLTDPHVEGPQKLDEIERQHILSALQRNSGNRTATAKELGISLRTLYYRLAEYEKKGYLA